MEDKTGQDKEWNCGKMEPIKFCDMLAKVKILGSPRSIA